MGVRDRAERGTDRVPALTELACSWGGEDRRGEHRRNHCRSGWTGRNARRVRRQEPWLGGVREDPAGTGHWSRDLNAVRERTLEMSEEKKILEKTAGAKASTSECA